MTCTLARSLGKRVCERDTRGAMRVVLLAAVIASACVSAPAAAPAPTSARTEAPAPAVTEAPPVSSPPPRLAEPQLAISADPFPIEMTLALRESRTAENVAHARTGVELYLQSLNTYRDTGSDVHFLSGQFRDVVVQGLRDSATPGVKRRLELESLRIDRLLVTPWGNPAIAEVTATIVDRVVEGSGADQRESGRLRLTNARLRVTDGWDYANGRWYNGIGQRPTADSIRQSLDQPLKSLLSLEQWAPGSPAQTWRADQPTPFSAAHAARIAAIDRTQTTSRTFEEVRASVERFDTFAEVSTGIATVRLTGTTVTTSSGGHQLRASFERRFKVLLFGEWAPEVVDEEVAPAVWLSGGDLALHEIDVNRA
jgi:hypothetical protein